MPPVVFKPAIPASERPQTHALDHAATGIGTKLLRAINLEFLISKRGATPPPPPVGYGLLIHEVSGSHTTTHRTRYVFSGRVISPTQRPLPDNTQQSQETDIHDPGGIRTRNPSRRAAADLRLKPRGHWDRQLAVFGMKLL